jgi:hypothetical protein
MQSITLFAPSTPIAGQTLKATESLCPTCTARVPAEYLATPDGRAYFSRVCPTHGRITSDLGPYAAFYEKQFRIDRLLKTRFAQVKNDPYLEKHYPFPLRQKAGLAMLEVTERCNLTCPMCYAGSGPEGRHYTLAEIRKRAEELIAVNGRGLSVQLSGGEPTVRKDLDKIIAMCYEVGFGHVEVISNGVRLAKDPEFALELKRWGATSLYLQFDSTRDDDIEQLRGERLWWVRERALAHLAVARLPTVLAVSILPGLNEDQVGPVMDVVARTDAIICGVNFQSATPFGGRFDLDAPRKLRLPDILNLLEQQCGISPEGVFPLGFGSPLCNAFARISYRDGRWQHAIPDFTLDDYLDLLGEDPVEFVRALAVGFDKSAPKLLKNVRGSARLVKKLLPALGANPIAFLRSKSTTLYIKPFMDSSDLDLERIERCCFHSATPRGVMSFCAVNYMGRDSIPVGAEAFEGALRPARGA